MRPWSPHRATIPQTTTWKLIRELELLITEFIDATKPEDWDKPEHIADPDATKPDDWDDDMDGEWEAPMVDNPDFKGNNFGFHFVFSLVIILIVDWNYICF